jgi:hypothetical protein
MKHLHWITLPLLMALSACATTVTDCPGLQARNLDAAAGEARGRLTAGCEARYHDYLDELLVIAEDDPGPKQREILSEFLVWSADEGLLSRRQAQGLYNRYFNVKFVAMSGDYNTCRSTCTQRGRVLAAMEDELRDKERGLLKVSRDADAYYRADRLFQETELVLEATCLACGTGGSAGGGR